MLCISELGIMLCISELGIMVCISELGIMLCISGALTCKIRAWYNVYQSLV